MLNYAKLQERIDNIGLNRHQVLILLSETSVRCQRNRDASVKRILTRLEGKKCRLNADEDGILDSILREKTKNENPT